MPEFPMASRSRILPPWRRPSSLSTQPAQWNRGLRHLGTRHGCAVCQLGPIRRAGHSVALTEDVLKEEPEPGWWFLFRKDVPYQCEDLGDGVQVEHFCELPDVLRVARSSGERLHREQMFW